jgi:hypothetical protein
VIILKKATKKHYTRLWNGFTGLWIEVRGELEKKLGNYGCLKLRKFE